MAIISVGTRPAALGPLAVWCVCLVSGRQRQGLDIGLRRTGVGAIILGVVISLDACTKYRPRSHKTGVPGG
jgi:hypothetical protein